MKITLGEEGCKKTWQAEFPKETKCVHCGGVSRIGFVAHEGMEEEVVYPRDFVQFVCDLHKNKGEGEFWLHDCASFATYLCKECLKPTTLYNQG